MCIHIIPCRCPSDALWLPCVCLLIAYRLPSASLKVEWLCRQGELESADWLKIGSVRLEDKAQQIRTEHSTGP